AVFGDRLGQLPLAIQGVAEVIVGHGVGGLEADRLPEFGDRLGELPPLDQLDAAVENFHGGSPPVREPEAHHQDRAEGQYHPCQGQLAARPPAKRGTDRARLLFVTLGVKYEAASAKARWGIGREGRTATWASGVVCVGHEVGLRRWGSGRSGYRIYINYIK